LPVNNHPEDTPPNSSNTTFDYNSANTGKDVILKAARAGCTSYLIKPIDQVRLYNEIRKHGLNVPEWN
jgi:response regulator of citrate/malate metabolism